MIRPLVGLFSEPSCLAVSLVENLLANFCRVEIVSRDKKTWAKKLEHVQSRGLVNISASKGIGKDVFDYALFLNFLPKEVIEYSQQNNIKSLAILPFKDIKTIDRKYQVPDTVGIIFVGDLFGPRMELANVNDLYKLKHPVFIGDAAKQITRWLFSFGPFGKETTLLSGPTNFDKVLKETIYWFSSHPQKRKSKLALIIGVLAVALSP